MIVCMTKVEEFYTSRKIVVIYFLHRVPMGDKQNFERGGVKEGGPNITGRREGGGQTPLRNMIWSKFQNKFQRL